MKTKFETSMMGELKFFLGLQMKRTTDKIFVQQIKYVKELLRKFELDKTKTMCTLMHPSTSMNLEKESKSVDITKYRHVIGLLLY